MYWLLKILSKKIILRIVNLNLNLDQVQMHAHKKPSKQRYQTTQYLVLWKLTIRNFCGLQIMQLIWINSTKCLWTWWTAGEVWIIIKQMYRSLKCVKTFPRHIFTILHQTFTNRTVKMIASSKLNRNYTWETSTTEDRVNLQKKSEFLIQPTAKTAIRP